MRLRFLPILACAALIACAPATQTPGGSGTPVTSGPASPSPLASPAPPAPPATEPTAEGVEYRVTYPFGVPSTQVVVSHPLTPPIAQPPSPPLPYLVAIYVGNHPEGTPPYQRISFYFRGAFPSYNVQYVRSVVDEGRGSPISLQGNGFLRVGFVDAQAHDEAGASTVKASPPASIGFKNLRSYGFAGDFEGHVSYGLGTQAAPNSDQVLRIRTGELKKPDGSGGFFYVVHVDVETG